MDLGVTSVDYRITISQHECVGVEITSDTVSCRPPDKEPVYDPTTGEGKREKGSHPVKVSINIRDRMDSQGHLCHQQPI